MNTKIKRTATKDAADRPIPYLVNDEPIPYRLSGCPRVMKPSAELLAFVVPKLGIVGSSAAPGAPASDPPPSGVWLRQSA
jgi:hypothetical protein